MRAFGAPTKLITIRMKARPNMSLEGAEVPIWSGALSLLAITSTLRERLESVDTDALSRADRHLRGPKPKEITPTAPMLSKATVAPPPSKQKMNHSYRASETHVPTCRDHRAAIVSFLDGATPKRPGAPIISKNSEINCDALQSHR